MRAAMGLEPIKDFNDPIFQDGYGQKLAQTYDNVNDIDFWVGGLAEKPTGDAMVGETLYRNMAEQFSRTISADPNWYESSLSASEVESFNNVTLGQIIRANTDAQNVDDTAMIASDNKHT